MAPLASQQKRPEVIRAFEYVMPQHINNHGTMFGGKLFEMMDKTAAIACLRYCQTPVVTACIDTMDFHVPIRQGNILEFVASVIHTGTTSIIVQVRVYTQPRTGGQQTLATTGNIVFVAVDSEGNPAPVPTLKVESEEERALWEEGARIKEALGRRKKNKLA